MTLVNALQTLLPPAAVDPAYVDLPIEQGFNWQDCFGDIDEGSWYLVVFRSRHQPGIDKERLTLYDEFAQQEARQSPDFLFYFMGTPNEQRHCLSFCLWNSQNHAQTAATRPAHQRAQKLTSEMYEWFKLERYVVKKSRGIPDSVIHFESVAS